MTEVETKTKQTSVGFDTAKADILAGRAQAHALWVILSDERQRDGYAIKPAPWEGSGEYQHVSYPDGRHIFVRVPVDRRALPLPEGTR